MSSSAGLFVLSAPSGAGKTSLAQRVLAVLPNLCFSVSHTTRPPRPGETEGTDYFFVSPKEFEAMIARGVFLEHAMVHGQHYGTSRRFVEEQLERGIDVLLDIDVQGALQVRGKVPECSMVFVLPPSMGELERRLRSRGMDDRQQIEKRLKSAREEIAHYPRYDYLVVNDEIERSVNELKSIIEAARCRLERRRERAVRIVKTFEVKKPKEIG